MTRADQALVALAGPGATRPVAQAKAQSGVTRALAHIHANPAQTLGCREIADMAGLSVSQCARQFRRVTGLAPHRYLLQVRVAHVKTLLQDAHRDLALIAMDAGFFDQSHMTRVFRRVTGTTPGAFRIAQSAQLGKALELVPVSGTKVADGTHRRQESLVQHTPQDLAATRVSVG